MAKKNVLKATSLSALALMLGSVAANAAVPANTIVIGNKAFSVGYLVDDKNASEIQKALDALTDPTQIYYQLEGEAKWTNLLDDTKQLDNAGLAAVIPTVTYYDADGKTTEEKFAETNPVSSVVSAKVSTTTPASGLVVKSAKNVPFTKITLTAADKDIKVTSIKVARTGLSQDGDVAAIRLFDGSTQKGGDGLLNNGTVTFDLTYDPITVEKGQTKDIMLKGDTGATSGRYLVLSVTDIKAVNADDKSEATVTATYPLNGNTMQVSDVAAGTLTVDVTSGGATVVRGKDDQIVDTLKLSNNNNEPMTINSVTFTRQGSSIDGDIQYVRLYDGQTKVAEGKTFSNGRVKVVFDSPYVLLKNKTANLSIAVKVAPGTKSSTSATLAVYSAADIEATGQISGESLVLAPNASFPETSGAITFSKGTLTTAAANTGIVDLSPVKGQDGVSFLKVKFSASADEDIKISKLRLARTGAAGAVDADLTNIRIVDANGNQVGPIISGFSSGYATVDLTGSPIVVKAGTDAVYTIKAGISASAVATHAPKIDLDTTDINNYTAKGMSSEVDVTMAGANMAGVGQTVASKGTLTVSNGTQELTNPVRGQKDKKVLQFKIAATNEDIKLNRLSLTYAGTSTNDIANVRLYDGDTQIGTAVSTLTGTAIVFSGLNYTVPMGTTKTITVKSDISGTAAVNNNVRVNLAAAATDISGIGLASGEDITPGAIAVNGTNFTVQSGTLGISSAVTLDADTYAVGQTDKEFARFIISAQSSDEDMNVTSIKLAATNSLANTDITDVKLYVGDTQIGTTKELDLSNEAVFNLTTPLTIAKGSAVTVSVKATPKPGLNNAHTGTFQIPVAGLTTVGVTSGITSALPTITPVTFANTMSLANGGTLTLKNSSTPVNAKNIVEASTANSLTKVIAQAGNTDVELTSIEFTGDASTRNNLINFTLWDGSTQIGSTIPELDANNKATFVLNTPLLIAKGAANAKALYIKADAKGAYTAYNLGVTMAATAATARTAVIGTPITGGSLTNTSTAKTHTTVPTNATVVRSATAPTGTVTASTLTKIGAVDITADPAYYVGLRRLPIKDILGNLNGKTIMLYDEATGTKIAQAAVTGGYAALDVTSDLADKSNRVSPGATKTFGIYVDSTSIADKTVVRVDVVNDSTIANIYGADPAVATFSDWAGDVCNMDISNVVGNNVTISNSGVTADTTAPARPTTVAFTSADVSDNYINDSEKGHAQTVRVNLNQPGGATNPAVGDTIRLLVNGGNLVTGTIVQGDLDAGYKDLTVPGATVTALAEGTITLSATITDAVGNVSSAATNTAVTKDTVVVLPAGLAAGQTGTVDANVAGGVLAIGGVTITFVDNTGAPDTLRIQGLDADVATVTTTGFVANLTTVANATISGGAQGLGDNTAATKSVTFRFVDAAGNSVTTGTFTFQNGANGGNVLN